MMPCRSPSETSKRNHEIPHKVCMPRHNDFNLELNTVN